MELVVVFLPVVVCVVLAMIDWEKNAASYRRLVSLWDRLGLMIPLVVIAKIFQVIEWRMGREEAPLIRQDAPPLNLLLFVAIAIVYWRLHKCGAFAGFFCLAHLWLALCVTFAVMITVAMA